jgi:hypothetical protein
VTEKWDVVRALKESGLPGPVRQVIRLILDEVDAKTCRTTDAHPVSIGKLEKWSGLGRSTVIRALDTAEETCWLERDRPETREALGEFATTHYHVMIGKSVVKEKRKRPSTPSATAGLGPERDHPSADAELGDEPSARAGLGSERDQGSATAGLGVVPERDHPSARAGHIIQPPTGVESHHSHQSPPSSSADAADAQPKPKKRAKKSEPQRDDVDQLCTCLADHIEKNTGERPRISEEWKTEARLLLDKDGRELDKALKLIDWCQNDEFWHTNILSMPTFRKQYIQLRTKAVAEWAKTKRVVTPQGPKSTAPSLLAESEKCEEHRRALPCGLCKSEQKGRTNHAA